jgi:DNA damage-binding protein 1
MFPYPTEFIPKLITVPPSDSDSFPDGEPVDGSSGFLGGVLVVGGTKLLLFEMLSPNDQEKQGGKRRRLEGKKKSKDSAEVSKAKEKEKERASRKAKAKASVDWPWGEVTWFAPFTLARNSSVSNVLSSCCPVDDISLRYLIADAFGRLAMLSLNSLNDHGLVILPLGEVGREHIVIYVSNTCPDFASLKSDLPDKPSCIRWIDDRRFPGHQDQHNPGRGIQFPRIVRPI